MPVMMMFTAGSSTNFHKAADDRGQADDQQQGGKDFIEHERQACAHALRFGKGIGGDAKSAGEEFLADWVNDSPGDFVETKRADPASCCRDLPFS